MLKLKQGTFSHTLTTRGIAAYQIALKLLQAGDELNAGAVKPAPKRTKHEREDAVLFFESTIGRVEKILPKFAAGTPQHTLAIRRIRAFEIATTLIREGNNI